MNRRALVVGPRAPETDRDSGSQDIDFAIDALLESGWSVSFLGQLPADEPRYNNRLRAKGVAVFTGFDVAGELITNGSFDLALLAFWEPASHLLPLLHQYSPKTRTIVNSMDLHFVREARKSSNQRSLLTPHYGDEVVREINVYNSADAVIAVSDAESAVLGELLGHERIHTLPLADSSSVSTVALDDRRGLCFVGNFRHVPNVEAVQYLLTEVLPLVSPELLEQHPLRVIGNYAEERLAHIDVPPGVEIVGWVPELEPHLHRARASVIPLLHGAGVKRKVLESIRSGTPVVTTPIGAEGLHLASGRHAMIGDTAAAVADGVEKVLTDDHLWERLERDGRSTVDERHSPASVRVEFNRIVDRVAGNPNTPVTSTIASNAAVPAENQSWSETVSFGEHLAAVALAHVGERKLGAALVTEASVLDNPDSTAMVVAITGATPDAWSATIDGLPARGVHWLAVAHDRDDFWNDPRWVQQLDRDGERAYSDHRLALWALTPPDAGADPSQPGDAAGGIAVRVLGRARSEQPPLPIIHELSCSTATVTQDWSNDDPTQRTDSGDGDPTKGTPDWIVEIADERIGLLPGFLDRALTLMEELGVDRAQPCSIGPIESAPPITHRLGGSVAREVNRTTPLPITIRRPGAAPDGPTVILDEVGIEPLATVGPGTDPMDYAEVTWLASRNGDRIERHDVAPLARKPDISVAISTYERPELLAACLEGFAGQDLAPDAYEVVVVDDGSADDAETATAEIVASFAGRLNLTFARIAHTGRSAAKNAAVMLCRADLVLLFDDDDRAATDLLTEHLAGHSEHPDEPVAILGYTGWAPEIDVTPIMHFVTDVGMVLFAYPNLTDGQVLDWRGFWEGRISCKRSLLLRHALHDERLAYSIDVEMALRLAPLGLRVVYRQSAQSYMVRGLTFDDFARRTDAKGRARVSLVAIHPDDPALANYVGLTGVDDRLAGTAALLPSAIAEVERLESTVSATTTPEPADLDALHYAYRSTLRTIGDQAVAEAARDLPEQRRQVPIRAHAAAAVVEPVPMLENPELTVTIPVWSRTPELARMAERTHDRIREVARLRTEIVIVDNDSPHASHYDGARVLYNRENHGVSIGWNQGIALAQAPLFAVLNSDCLVEPGWDEALAEAALDGRRIAFPFTDHGDGDGFRRPDQAGTAGWCFLMARDLYEELGPFDERFSPAFGEDTDYWHRAWAAGVELSPVPAARVFHERRQTTGMDPRSEKLLLAHRHKYGWKHDVEPLAAPPYYNRDITDYTGKPISME